jgi:hypothetical protein
MRNAAVVATTLLVACASVTPHQNFVAHMEGNIGKRIDDPSAMWVMPQHLLGTSNLANGDVEYVYRFQGSCRYFFEVDPKSNVMVKWRYEGSDRDCAIMP